MKNTFNFITEQLGWLFKIAFFLFLVVGIGWWTDYGWRRVFVEKQRFPSFISYNIDNIETVLASNKNVKRFYAELAQKRLDYEKNILKSMDNYETISDKIYNQYDILQKNIGEKMSISEVIELFASGDEIPSELIPANSAYNILKEKLKNRKQLQSHIDEHERENLLGSIEEQMEVIKSYIDNEKIMDAQQIQDMERTIATLVSQIPQDIIADHEATQELYRTFTPEPKRKTKLIFIKRD